MSTADAVSRTLVCGRWSGNRKLDARVHATYDKTAPCRRFSIVAAALVEISGEI